MKKILALSCLFALLAFTAACHLEQQARDAAAGLNGSITAAQAKYQSSCESDPKQQICQTINRGVSAQNALITASEAYCGWSSANPPADKTVTCVPVKDAKAGLTAAIANANQLTLELKGAF